MFELSIKSKAEFLTSLEQITSEAAALSHGDLLSAIKSVPEDNFTANELSNLVDFAAEQIGQWQVRWLFSLAQAPDVKAEAESYAWDNLWEAFAKMLIEKHPEIETLLRKKKDLLIAQRQVEREVQLDSDNPAAKFASPIISYLARMVSILGCKGIARRLMARALYPSGTVGRAPTGPAPPRHGAHAEQSFAVSLFGL